MANEKYLYTTKMATGVTAYVIIRYLWYDEVYIDDSDGTLQTSPADPFVSLTEHSVVKGLYELYESRALWYPGRYVAYFYVQAGGSPSPVADELVESKEFFMAGDEIATDFPFEISIVLADAGNGATSFKTELESATNGYCVGSYLKFASGALVNQVRRISAYNGTSKVVTVSSAFTAVPAEYDEFYIINQ